MSKTTTDAKQIMRFKRFLNLCKTLDGCRILASDPDWVEYMGFSRDANLDPHKILVWAGDGPDRREEEERR